MTMNREPFLKRVAEAYMTNEPGHISRMCFVFPNKRSSAFFSHYLRQFMKAPALMPEMLTISELIGELAPCAEASRLDMLFTLYTEYRKLAKAEDVGFDRFIYWGDMLIRDFDDVDRYLVDPAALFVNVKRFREIRSNYLTPRQLEIISRYWDGVEDYTEGVDRFWQHIDEKASSTKDRFIKLWEILLPLYEAYNKALESRNLSSPGHLYRLAVDTLKENDGPIGEFERIIFVGFNVLSASELELFRTIDARGIGDYYWDMIDPVFRESGDIINKALRFVSRNAALFKSRYDIDRNMASSSPHVHIIGVPSRIGQAKAVAERLDKIASDGETDPSAAIDTAVILPDENLFLPLIGSIPDKFAPINVTMGYPMKRTPVATFIKALVSMHVRARKSSDRWYYFYEDLASVVSNSLPQGVASSECKQILQQIRKERRFMVDAEMLCNNYPSLRQLFLAVDPSGGMKAAVSYIRGLLSWLKEGVNAIKSSRDAKIQLEFINGYSYALDMLEASAAHYCVEYDAITAFRLIERSVGSEQITMKGDPLRGLQIMGVLESRALDFKNIIMPSMNERIFPKRIYTRSFIPEALRKAYRMSTAEHQESIFAYYFYRLVSHASDVTLLYDSRTIGLHSSEMSRFLIQLLYSFGNKIKITHHALAYNTAAFVPSKAEVVKDERIMAKLREFLIPPVTPDSKCRCLSASSINTYIDCPLQFYLRYVEGFDVVDDVDEYISASMFGTIVHAVMERLYLTASEKGTLPVTVTELHIKRWLSAADTTIHDLTKQVIAEKYLKEEAKRPNAFDGEPGLMGSMIEKMVRSILSKEVAITPFEIIATEHKICGQMELAPGLYINVTGSIDRVDRVNGQLRIVDYKTGEDELSTPSISSAFDPAQKKRQKAFVQIFFYCQAYSAAQPNKASEPIKPMIYSIKNVYSQGLEPLKAGEGKNKVDIEDYRTYAEDYKTNMAAVIQSLFDPNVNFSSTAAPDNHVCKYCNFKSVCGITDDDN